MMMTDYKTKLPSQKCTFRVFSRQNSPEPNRSFFGHFFAMSDPPYFRFLVLNPPKTELTNKKVCAKKQGL